MEEEPQWQRDRRLYVARMNERARRLEHVAVLEKKATRNFWRAFAVFGVALIPATANIVLAVIGRHQLTPNWMVWLMWLVAIPFLLNGWRYVRKAKKLRDQ
jgi:hypothetical protein